jgi:hypothetical protein
VFCAPARPAKNTAKRAESDKPKTILRSRIVLLLKQESVNKRIFVSMQLSPSSREFLDRVGNHPGAILHGGGYTSCHGVVTLMENSGLHF